MRKLFLAASLAVVVLAGCAGSTPHKLSHPSRRVLDIDGYQISVVKYPEYYLAWNSGVGFFTRKPSDVIIKPVLVKAVEMYSGCKVVDIELMPNDLANYSEVKVNCDK